MAKDSGIKDREELTTLPRVKTKRGGNSKTVPSTPRKPSGPATPGFTTPGYTPPA